MISRTLGFLVSASALAALAATGCSRSACQTFMSENAGTPGPSQGSSGGMNAGSSASPADAARAVEEADIIQVDGGRLYAMSKTGGLSIVDVSDSNRLALLGKQAIAGIPFEMYRRGDVILSMSNNALDGKGGEVATPPVAPEPTIMGNGQPAPLSLPYSAQVTALDVRNPGAVNKLASFEVPGEVADSRMVGDVLYVVSYENGECWHCSSGKRTVITSFDVSNPTKMAQVDQISFMAGEIPGYAAGWQRSVAATAQRLYVAGNDYRFDADGNPMQSTIDVLDVSDPTGHIKVGQKLLVKGQILSRWQMDEHEGVLRVVSQRDIAITRNGSGAPFVDTFKIESSSELLPLGSTTIKLPIQEALKAVRFDGARAYAITFRNTDPLFTLDLSDPAAPVQKGELEIPGFVHHIEPRGDRLVALGVDQGAMTGALNVSLFDVSDMTKPTMLSRVSFGAYGGLQDLTEDQNRIHKAFRVFDEHGLIAVPFTSHYERGYGSTSCTPSQGGIQLIDLTKSGLATRALLQMPGTPRRALVHEGRLLTVSETNIQAYSLVNRSSSAPLASLATGTCTLHPNGGYDGHGYPNGGYYGNDYREGYGGWGGGTCE